MNVEDFDSFMGQVHGHPPFPWQSQVVTEAVERGAWPALVDVPTGLGKTSMLDIAVFLLAMSAGGEAPAGLAAGSTWWWIGGSSSTRRSSTAGSSPMPWLRRSEGRSAGRSPSDYGAFRPLVKAILHCAW